MIRNYGLFWKKDEVVWGSRGPWQAGCLMGRMPGYGARHVDFGDQQGIYVLYDSTFKLVYVGQVSSGLLGRLRNHNADHLTERWDRFSWFGFRKVNQKGHGGLAAYAENLPNQTKISVAVDHCEAILIATAEPPLNRRSGKFGNAQQYLQVPMNEVE